MPDITKFGWGCVVCNPERAAAAARPEVPVVPGPADRMGCLQHGEIDCKRCGVLEVRLRMAVEEHVEREPGHWAREERRWSGALVLLGIVLALLAFVVGCGWLFWNYYPAGAR